MPRLPWLPILILAGLLVIPAILAPWLTPHDPLRGELLERLTPPGWVEGGSWTYPLGTDGQGRDILTRIIFGARISLSVAMSAIGIGLLVGGSLGLVGGYFGGFIDKVIMWMIDTFLSLPFVLLALVVVSAIGPSFQLVIVLTSATVWAYVARQVRGETLSIREQDFVARARVSGLSALKIIRRHIVPNTVSPLIVVATLQVGLVILEEASLSFIGAGIPPPNPSWGVMVAGGRDLIASAWWVSFFPGLAILSIVLALNSLGDWLRDYLDPRTRQQMGSPLRPAGRTPARGDGQAGVPEHPSDGLPPAVLEVSDLRTYLFTRAGVTRAVDGVTLSVRESETVGIVGESGSGKTMLGLSIVRLTPEHVSRIVGGEIRVGGTDVSTLPESELRGFRAANLSMIFQDPEQSLNPVFTVGSLLNEAIRARFPDLSAAQVQSRAVEALRSVNVPDPERRLRSFPHQLSGGMKQRVVSAMAMIGQPKLIIADEPTTSLDATIQAQFLHLLKDLQARTGVALLLITHDFGIIAELADRVAVMYAGRLVEQGAVRDIFNRPSHPYTRALLEARPAAHTRTDRLKTIEGNPPSLIDLPVGCRFAPRCAYATEECDERYPPETVIGELHRSACLRAEEEPWLNRS